MYKKRLSASRIRPLRLSYQFQNVDQRIYVQTIKIDKLNFVGY